MGDKSAISLTDMYIAYRKAKSDAFYDASHLDALAFIEYEEHLHDNLRRLLAGLRKRTSFQSASSIGTFGYVPKSVEVRREETRNESVYFKCMDPTEEWERQWSSKVRANAKFRLVIRASVDFQVFSALWIIKAGHTFDAILDPNTSYGHRLRRLRDQDDLSQGAKALNLDCVGLFEPYFTAYRQWRQRGLAAMREALEKGARVFGVTMDIRNFYHRATPDFLLRQSFLERFNIELDPLQTQLTETMIQAIHIWYRTTPDATDRPQGGLPVGLSASKVIANVLLADLDDRVVQELDPLYYGRYVDDIFLVFEGKKELTTGREVMSFLADTLQGMLVFEAATEVSSDQMRLTLPYASSDEADLIFAGEKQKVFNLVGKHGLDLVGQIEHQIAAHSSEHRLLSIVPSSSEEMAAKTLMAQSEAALEADALRKADVVSVRRLGLALMLRDLESYARDLRPSEWRDIRTNFYDLIERHVLTPPSFFSYTGLLPRVVGMMVASGDYRQAGLFIDRLVSVLQLIERTTSAGTIQRTQYDAALALLKISLAQAVAQATTVAHFRWHKDLVELGRSLDQIHSVRPLPRSIEPFRRLSKRILHTDLGRRPYRESWLGGATRELPNPSVPGGMEIRRHLRLGAVRAFRKAAGLRLPYWPALAFPTRPLNLSEITRAAPTLLQHPRELRAALFAMRGAKARSHDGVSFELGKSGSPDLLRVDGISKPAVNVAVPSFLTSDEEWLAAVAGRPRLTRERYERVRRLVNGILRDASSVDYVVLPECSIPPHWISTVARKFAEKGISLIAGLEYRQSAAGLHNEAYLSIATKWPWHRTSVIYVQPKFAPAHEEKRTLAAHRKRLAVPPTGTRPTIVQHEGLCFSVLICSDLTNITHRYDLHGRIDALLVVEWNRDIESFASLIEATANDLHTYVVQVNNRLYGDSRIRSPRKESYQRDVVRVKGGAQDYFVVASLDIAELRRFQSSSPTTSAGPFKPTPIGYSMSKERGGTLKKSLKPRR